MELHARGVNQVMHFTPPGLDVDDSKTVPGPPTKCWNCREAYPVAHVGHFIEKGAPDVAHHSGIHEEEQKGTLANTVTL